MNGDFCNTEIHHTVIGETGIKSKELVYIVDKVITALDLVRLTNDSILYVGTDDGEIATVCNYEYYIGMLHFVYVLTHFNDLKIFFWRNK